MLRCLKGAVDFKLIFRSSANNEIIDQCDAEWASDADKRRSTTGYVFRAQISAISWASRHIVLRQTLFEIIMCERSTCATEHINVRKFFIQDPTNEMVADKMTDSGWQQIKEFRSDVWFRRNQLIHLCNSLHLIFSFFFY